jgi:hypothetical protein
MKEIASYGSPDYFFTEYFRVHASSSLDKNILSSITENSTGRPIFARLIGKSIPDLVRTAKQLSNKLDSLLLQHNGTTHIHNDWIKKTVQLILTTMLKQ